MTGLGIVLGFIGYACVAWGVNSIEGHKQRPFIQQIFPFAQPTK